MMSIEEWLAASISKIELNTKRLTGIQEFFPQLHDFATTIVVNKNEARGRGTKTDEDLAIKVSLIEALERIFVRYNKVDTTNGVAAHLDKDQAKIKAKFELIERDLFLSHFITKTPFTPLLSLPSLPSLPSKALDFITNASDKFSFYKMRPSNLGTGYVCVISGEDRWGGLFGLSFGNESQDELIQSAFIEAFRQYLYFRTFNELDQSISFEEFFKLESWDFKKHSLLSRNVKYFKDISNFFDESFANERLVIYEDNEFTFKDLRINIQPFDTAPIHVVQCSSPYCQNLYLGPLKEESISRPGLTRFLGFTPQQLNMMPHPMN